MKKRIFLCLLILFFLRGLASGQDKENWESVKSTHFIIYYRHSAEQYFLQQLIENAEKYYDDIADHLGFTRYQFWTWDNRAKIYLYDDAKDYLKSTGQPDWSSGCAQVAQKTIYTFPFAKGFFESILPHELSHIIFREFVGFDNKSIPLWLDEGVATYEGNVRLPTANTVVITALKEGRFIELGQLAKLDPQQINGKEAAELFYAESVSVIYYLLEEFGRDYFVLFCQNLRDKQDFDRALSSSYPFSNLEELGRAWKESLH